MTATVRSNDDPSRVVPLFEGARGDTVDRKMTPDIAQAKRFLDHLLGADAQIGFQVLGDSSSYKGAPGFKLGNIVRLKPWLEASNNAGAGVFFVVNEVTGERRRTENVTRVRALFVDLDGEPLESVLHWCEDHKVMPHAQVESSPGRYHAYWKITDCPLEKFTPAQEVLAEKFNGDGSVKDLPRVMRLPGYYHLKGEPFRSKILSLSDHAPHNFEDFVSRMDLSLESDSDGLTPLQAHEGINGKALQPGSRHVDFTSIAGSFRKMGLDAAEIESVLLDINRRRGINHDEEDIRRIAQDIGKAAGGGLPEIAIPQVKVMTLDELQKTEIPPVKWVIPQLLPEGLTVLAGKPKMGKSWLLLNLMIALSYGDRALDRFKCQQAPVLYLALEDTAGRFKSRLTNVIGERPAPKLGFFTTEWPKLSDKNEPGNALDLLHRWLEANEGAQAIFIDTFTKIRPGKQARDLDYERDYRHLEGLQRLAGQYGLSVIVCHHQRKAEAEDEFDTVHGSQGITGAADATWILSRPDRFSNRGELAITGRDYPETLKIALDFNKETCSWEWTGEVSDLAIKREHQEILDAIPENESVSIKQLEERTNLKYRTVHARVSRMIEEGLIEKTLTGRFQMRSPQTHLL